jgi:hypothetical protein
MDICSFGGQQPRHDSDGLRLIRLPGPATTVETTCLDLLIPRTYVVVALHMYLHAHGRTATIPHTCMSTYAL